MNRVSKAAVVLVTLLVLASAPAAERAPWHPEPPARWTALELPTGERAGFTRMPSEQTGIHFTNVLDEWSSAANRVLENGGGVAVGDYDGDGRPDIFLCSLKGQSALYRNLGGWQFRDVTPHSGIQAADQVCRGAVFADVNGDAWLDLLVSTLGHGVLCFTNDGTGRFNDATQTAGTESKFGSTSLALADVDGDGTLDLYVVNYRTEDIRDRCRVGIQRINGQVVPEPALRGRVIVTKDGLREYGEPDILYANDGKGHFRPVPWTGGRFLDESGKPLADPPLDWGLTATFRDLNGDGHPDLYVCNDYWTPDRIWINDGTGRFRAIARLAIRHTSENSMGVDVADIDRDGHPDLLVLDMLSRDPVLRKRQVLAQTRMNWPIGEIANRPQVMRNALFHNRGDGTFEEIADFCGLPASEWSWQPVFIDVDLDGYEDLLIPAGHTRDVQDLDATAQIKSRQHSWPKDINPQVHQEAFTREMMEHARLYPRLEMPVIAFRNLGNLQFEDATRFWGTDTPGVHQGIAFGDLDGDGDLDFVVNNLNGLCGVYRNDSNAPRVAVRLRGLPPNTQGVGALISVYGGAVPMQSQEMIYGGRYLSGDEGMRAFAAGSLTNRMRIEVRWRSGQHSVVSNVLPNRLYEIDEANPPAGARAQPSVSLPRPFFEDVSRLLQHTHHDEDFDDYARQPLLPRKLSQAGPGVAWQDVDGDGWEDLLIGSGRGGHLAVYRNDGKGRFQRWAGAPFGEVVSRDQTGIVGTGSRVLVGSSNYEDGLTNGACVRVYDRRGKESEPSVEGQVFSTGPLAVADIDGDGDLDLFVGGRVIPGRYPEPAHSQIYANEGGKFTLMQELAGVGLVSGAVWSDLDGDGFPELILACEWGSVRVWRRDPGMFRDVTRELGLETYTGWWNGVTTGDFDGDGRLDIVASNWGQNTKYGHSNQQPERIYYGDFNADGTVQMLEAYQPPELGKLVPWRGLDPVAQALPWVRERFTTHSGYASAGVNDILGDKHGSARSRAATTLDSRVFLNRGGRFETRALPTAAQFSPAFATCVGDLDGDGKEDVFLSQNFFAVEPGTLRHDAGRGLWMRGDGKGSFTAVSGQESGITVYGEQRGAALGDYDGDGRVDLVVTQNGAETRLYHNRRAEPGLRVRLQGPEGNPCGIGSQLRLVLGGRMGPVREIHGGSGYWSQDSVVQVLGTPEAPTAIWVRWPGGTTTTSQVPPHALTVLVNTDGLLQLQR